MQMKLRAIRGRAPQGHGRHLGRGCAADNQTQKSAFVVHEKVRLSPHACESFYVQSKLEGSPTGLGITGANESPIFVAASE